MAVSVQRAVVLVVTPCRVTEFIIPSFSTMKLQMMGSSIFMVETELVASSKTFVNFYQTSYAER